MNYEELKERKQKLDKDITNLVIEFEKDTGFDIENVIFSYSDVSGEYKISAHSTIRINF